MANVEELLITPLRRVFGQPKSDDVPGYYSDLSEDLKQFSADTLEAAVRILRQNRKFSSFPTIAECVAACREAQDRHEAAPKAKVTLPWENKAGDVVAKDRRRQGACKVCNCELGREADAGGWLPALIEFVEAHNRLPAGREIETPRSTAARHERNIEQLFVEAKAMNLPNPLGPAISKFRTIMLDKAHRDVFGDNLPADHRQPDYAARLKANVAQSQAVIDADKAAQEKHLAHAADVGSRPMPPMGAALKKSLGLPS